jgi:hypothetical protein
MSKSIPRPTFVVLDVIVSNQLNWNQDGSCGGSFIVDDSVTDLNSFANHREWVLSSTRRQQASRVFESN